MTGNVDTDAELTLCRLAHVGEGRIMVTDDSAILTVVTGMLHVEIPKTYGGILHRVVRAGTELLSAPETGHAHERGPWVHVGNTTFYGSLLTDQQQPPAAGTPMDTYIKSQQGTRFNTYHPFNLEVVVEDLNNITAGVRVSGAHISPDGDYKGTFITRLRFYRRGDYVKVMHTYIHTGDNSDGAIAGYGLRVPWAWASHPTSTAIDEGLITGSVGSLLQDSYDSYTITDGRRGASAMGTISKESGDIFLGVVLRDMAQYFPKSLAALTDGIDIQLYPLSAPPWDMSVSKCDSESTNSGAQGLAKTDHFWVTFDKNITTSLAQQARKGPLMLVASPEWYSSSLAMGVGTFVFDKDQTQSPCKYRLHKSLKVIADFVKYNQNKFGWYGHDTYGSIKKEFNGNEVGSWTWEPNWSANSGDPLNSLWLQFMRDQEWDTFLLAEALARHTFDMQIVHFGGYAASVDTPGTGGNSYHAVGSSHRHSCTSWSNTANFVEYTFIGGVETYYYLTGDARARDVMFESARFVERYHDPQVPFNCGLDIMARAAQMFYDQPEMRFVNTTATLLLGMKQLLSPDKIYQYLRETAPGLQYYYEVGSYGPQRDTAADLLFTIAEEIISMNATVCSLFEHITPLTFAMREGRKYCKDVKGYAAIVARCMEEYTHADRVSLEALSHIPTHWEAWNWSWSSSPETPGLLWLDREYVYKDNTLQGSQSLKMFTHVSTGAAFVDHKCIPRPLECTLATSYVVHAILITCSTLLCVALVLYYYVRCGRVRPMPPDIDSVALLECTETELMPPGWISWSDLSCLEHVAEGVSGYVFRAVYEVTKEVVAVKEAKNTDSKTFINEMNLLCSLRQRDILLFYGWTQQEGKLYMVTEYCAHGALTDYNYDTPRETAALSLLAISRALAYIHDRGLVHMDVAARNVFVDEKKSFKLGDMGLMKVIGSEIGGPVPVAWSPPEALDAGTRRTAQTQRDVWAFGCLVYEVLEGKQPYWDVVSGNEAESLDKVATAIQSGIRPLKPRTLGPLGEVLWSRVVLNCWIDNPSQRCTMHDVITTLTAIEASPLAAVDRSSSTVELHGVQQRGNPYVTLNIYGDPPERSESMSLMF
eukprot:TRINITY_DN15571_c0_g1_i1.p1 TRINITY_DN15571_c0_g1~~TRINITY_DN15571_c0_g1_i1.p1  ORF type:complete len:1197 (+),score=178.03 TRINITY_DN15571_c0_g1_i1:286-3591(+)